MKFGVSNPQQVQTTLGLQDVKEKTVSLAYPSGKLQLHVHCMKLK